MSDFYDISDSDDDNIDWDAVARCEARHISKKLKLEDHTQTNPNPHQNTTNHPQPPLPPPPPTSIASLLQRITHFEAACHPSNPQGPLPRPPPTPTCPGIFGRGCGSPLTTRRVFHDLLPPTDICSCDNERCKYVFCLPTRLLKPQIVIMAASLDELVIKPAPGAEEVFHYCGGMKTVLRVLGVLQKWNSNINNINIDDDDDDDDGKNDDGIKLPLSDYNALKSAFHYVKITYGLDLLPRANEIPSATLSALLLRSNISSNSTGGGNSIDPLTTTEVATQSKALPLPLPLSQQHHHPLLLHLPPFISRALLPFQLEGVQFSLARGGRVLIADEMGVGKTVQAISLASCYQHEWPLLIIVPASLRLVWAEEIEKWRPDIRPGTIHLIECRQDRLSRSNGSGGEREGGLPLITVTSYEMMQRLTCSACKKRQQATTSTTNNNNNGGGGEKTILPRPPPPPPSSSSSSCLEPEHCMATMGWKVIIIDESHTLRTTGCPIDAQHTEAVATACHHAHRVIMLSGTPSFTRPFDLYRQIDCLVPGMLGKSKQIFSTVYCNRRQVPIRFYSNNNNNNGSGVVPSQQQQLMVVVRGEGVRYDNSGLARGEELHVLLKHTVMLRRLKKDVLSQLPAKRRQVVRLPAPKPSAYPNNSSNDDDGDGGDKKGKEKRGTDDEDDNDDEHHCHREGKVVMNAFHRLGVAKVELVVQWLMDNLGIAAATTTGGGDDDDDGEEDGNSSGGNSKEDSRSSSSSSGGPKFIVFAHHKTVMNCIAAALDGAGGGGGISSLLASPSSSLPAATSKATSNGNSSNTSVKFVRIDGETEAKERHAAATKFRADPSIRVALLSITAAGVGLDFSAASVVVFAELPQEAALVRQAEDRAHRQGQKQAVNVYFLCCKGTPDEQRWQKLNRSLIRVDTVHDGDCGGGGGNCGGGGLQLDDVLDDDDEDREEGEPLSHNADDDEEQQQKEEELNVSPTIQPQLLDTITTTTTTTTKTAPPPPVKIKRQPTGVSFWFEVSPNTERVHIHTSPDGTAPCLLNIPIESLVEVDDDPLFDQLMAAIEREEEEEEEQQQPCIDAAASSPPKSSQATKLPLPPLKTRQVVIAELGVLAVDLSPSLTSLSSPSSTTKSDLVYDAIQQAKEFASEWKELRAIHRSKLAGRVLQSPLSDQIEELEQSARDAGRLGQGIARFKERGGGGGDGNGVVLPEGAEWKEVRVWFARYRKEQSYMQPMLPDGRRLCMHCAKPVPGGGGGGKAGTSTKGSKEEEDKEEEVLILQSTLTLFCSGDCETQHAVQTNGGAYRCELFKLERGVCVLCKLDCHELVRRLRSIDKGSSNNNDEDDDNDDNDDNDEDNNNTTTTTNNQGGGGSEKQYIEQRKKLLQRLAPQFFDKGHKAQMDKLVKSSLEGNAWHADHIIPVYAGGGRCGVENLRTLCVLCHKRVTAEQARERKKQRAAGKVNGNGKGGRQLTLQESMEEGGGEGRKEEKRRKKKVRRRAETETIIIESSPDD